MPVQVGWAKQASLIMFGEALNRGRKSIKQSIWGEGKILDRVQEHSVMFKK